MRIRLLFYSDSSPLHGTNLAFLSFKGPLDRYFGTALDQIALPAPDNFVVPEEATSGAGDNVTVATAAAIITRAAARLLGG